MAGPPEGSIAPRGQVVRRQYADFILFPQKLQYSFTTLPRCGFYVAPKATGTSGTPEPTLAPSGQPNPSKRGLLIGDAPSSPKSTLLRSVEHVKEHSHAQAAKRINE
jgi:hypothetical protein